MKEKQNFWHRIAEHDLYQMLQEMGLNEERFVKFQKKRFTLSLLMFIPFIFFSIFFNKWLFIAGVGVGVFVWTNEYNRATKFYRNFQFEKQLDFSKFMRMLIPYLLQSGATLYSVFNRMLGRLDEGHVKRCLERLLIEMNEQPNSEEPFKKFAIDASGTDSAVLFMTTLYDFQQNTFDHSIITELGQMASEELFEGVDDIIAYKLRKFVMYPTKLTMASFLITAGYAVAMLTDVVTSISF
jgi:hypothetical protein